jgi:hypothetical protein
MQKEEIGEIEKSIIFSKKNDMADDDLIELVLIILYKILDYTNNLEQRTPSIFDQKNSTNLEQEINSDKLSTSSSSNEENINFEKNKKNKNDENLTLHYLLYFWIKKLEFNKNLLLLTMMNIDKLLSSDFILTEDNIKNVLFTCMILTQKNYEDDVYNDKDYAKLIDISTEDLIKMEIEFLKYINFSLYINEEKFNNYQRKMYNIWENTLSFFNFS